jgi:hypothetical protein
VEGFLSEPDEHAIEVSSGQTVSVQFTNYPVQPPAPAAPPTPIPGMAEVWKVFDGTPPNTVVLNFNLFLGPHTGGEKAHSSATATQVEQNRWVARFGEVPAGEVHIHELKLAGWKSDPDLAKVLILPGQMASTEFTNRPARPCRFLGLPCWGWIPIAASAVLIPALAGGDQPAEYDRRKGDEGHPPGPGGSPGMTAPGMTIGFSVNLGGIRR